MTLNITDAELHEWANMRADDAGRLARELVACRLQSQAAAAAAYEAAARVVDPSSPAESCTCQACNERKWCAQSIRALATPDQIAALAAERAATVTVKPLEWEKHPMGWIAAPPTGQAYIIDIRVKGRVMFIKGMNPSPQCSNIEAAKAAAQADYDARIRSAITITSGTDSAKLHKAVEALRESVLAIQYLDERAPSGTTPPTLAKITAVLAETGGA